MFRHHSSKYCSSTVLVLEQGPCQADPPLGPEALERLGHLGLWVLDPVDLVDHDRVPPDPVEVLHVLPGRLEGGEDHLQLARAGQVQRGVTLVAMEAAHGQAGPPWDRLHMKTISEKIGHDTHLPFQLCLPVEQHGSGRHHQEEPLGLGIAKSDCASPAVDKKC